MRWPMMCLGLLFAAGMLPAAPVRPEGSAPAWGPIPPPQLQEATNYAHQLTSVLSEIEQNYVRPVQRPELAYAALAGLYEAVRLPVPSMLRASVERAKDVAELTELLIRVRLELGDPEVLKGTGALLVSIRGMTRALDPHSGLLTGEELRRGNTSGPVQGVGLELEETGADGPAMIKAVAPGSPAQRAGLRPGDRITHIDGKPVDRDSLVLTRLRLLAPQAGEFPNSLPRSDEFALTVQRTGVKELWKVKLEAETFRAETILGVIRHDTNAWDFWLDRERKVAHVRITTLASGTAGELKEVLTRLKADGLRGILLDLRWCPGGFLNESLDVAQLFLGECTIATVKSRSQGEDVFRSVKDDAKLLDIPLVVLVNVETSGGAELIAAALQDNGRALIAGQRTRGKGSIQTTNGLPVPNTGLKLTSGTFLRPSGKNLHRFPDSKPSDDWGVRPEPKLELRLSAELSCQLKEWWLLQSLRPGPSREVLPLDGPRADAQQFGAVQALLPLLK